MYYVSLIFMGDPPFPKRKQRSGSVCGGDTLEARALDRGETVARIKNKLIFKKNRCIIQICVEWL